MDEKKEKSTFLLRMPCVPCVKFTVVAHTIGGSKERRVAYLEIDSTKTFIRN